MTNDSRNPDNSKSSEGNSPDDLKGAKNVTDCCNDVSKHVVNHPGNDLPEIPDTARYLRFGS